MNADEVLQFWFEALKPAQWWRANPALDAVIRERFGALHREAASAELYAWRGTPRGRLAEVIVLDQFSRNLHRGTPHAFACDAMALVLAQEAVDRGVAATLQPRECAFLCMPFMHSESRRIQAESERLFREPGLADNLESALAHKAVVDRFGRFPHRNAILGRESTAEELAFLTQPGSRF